MSPRAWDHLQWGILFRNTTRDDSRWGLIGEGWCPVRWAVPSAPGTPLRALLFTRRAAARAWCRAKQASYAGRTDYCATWRFRPVRVREQVRIVGGTR